MGSWPSPASPTAATQLLSTRPFEGHAAPRRGRRVSSCGVNGMFARIDGRWVLENDSELAVLAGLGGSHEGVARLRAMVAALGAGAAGPGDLARLSRSLQALAEADEVWGGEGAPKI